MTSSFTVSLHNLRFFAAHGLFKEEQSTGNEFEVNLTMNLEAPDELVRKIEDTIDYAAVYAITKDIFIEPKQLLETIAMEIAVAVKNNYPVLKGIQVQIIKLHPPITNFTGSVSVTYNKEF
jgi:7,8-dihydroneopterin aldolase/epimerase/oxygenase